MMVARQGQASVCLFIKIWSSLMQRQAKPDGRPRTRAGAAGPDSPIHARTCGVCAEACERCATECEQMAGGDRQMLDCAEACRRCADSCRQMAQMA